MMLTLAILWGGSYFWSALALRELPPFTIVSARLVLGSVLLIGYIHARGYSLALPLPL